MIAKISERKWKRDTGKDSEKELTEWKQDKKARSTEGNS